METATSPKFFKHEPALFLMLAAMPLALLAIDTALTISRGITKPEWPFAIVGILELLIPAALCILAARQVKQSDKRILPIVALCVCGLMLVVHRS